MTEPVDLEQHGHCFEGAIPALLATVSADGVPNVTFISKAHLVDRERLALSNQFMSKSARNLAEHPRASIMLMDPGTYEELRLDIVYERTERRGTVFEDLRQDVEAIAAMTGMRDVFRLRSADIYRVEHAEVVAANERADGSSAAPPVVRASAPPVAVTEVAELCRRLNRCGDLDSLLRVTVDGLAQLLHHEHTRLLLLDESGERLFTIASHGYAVEGVGSEVLVGEGILGVVAQRGVSMRLGNARQMRKYSERLRAAWVDSGEVAPGREVPLPGLPMAESCVAVPLQSLGQLIGVLAVEADLATWYSEDDEAALTVVASVLANAIESIRASERDVIAPAAGSAPASAPPSDSELHVRFFPVDGSTFLDGDYLIKGVAGRLLWSLLRQHADEGRVDFTNREVRLDPSLDLPDFRDNFESRLILLKRRLDEREAPVRIEKTGRGRFRLVVEAALRLDQASS